MNFIKKHFYSFFFLLVVGVFFSPFLLNNLNPIPSDTIVGMYHPYRDYYSQNYPNGIPFKNFLITDPVRQIIPWKSLGLNLLSSFEFPLWNPYEMAGQPLLANFQSSVFYPLNLILFIKPFSFSWSIFILIQEILAGLFLYLYLKNLKLDRRAIILGVISFCFSGFFISWLEWGNIIHTALWLPLILLSIDKIVSLKNFSKLWTLIFILSVSFSFFGGHLQVFFYSLLFSLLYLFVKLLNYFSFTRLFTFIFSFILILLIISIQLIPTLQFIFLSARSIDQANWLKEGWFIPWQNLIQYIVPDFFGNPATLNYWGVWNYGEFVGFIGIIPLFFVILSIISRKDKKTLFFGLSSFVFLIFALPTSVAKLPYILNIPFLSTAQPTRLLFLVTFCFAVLSSLGLDYFIRNKKILRKTVATFLVISLFFIVSWALVLFKNPLLSSENILIAKRNLIFPTMIFIFSSFLIFLRSFYKGIKLGEVIIFLLITVSSFDLLRFAIKFEPFTKTEYLFPKTKTIDFILMQQNQFRIASADSRILPPNFSTIYKIQSIEGYNPLYLISYAEFVSALENNNSGGTISFNRIITPHNVYSNLIDLLNVKYVLSIDALKEPKFTKVFEEGETKIYKNNNAFERAFFVKEIKIAKNTKDQLDMMLSIDLKRIAIVDEDLNNGRDLSIGKVNILNYGQNNILIETDNMGEGFLVLSDNYYPTWRAKIDGNNTKLYRADHTLRGVLIPSGKHKILFYNQLL